MTQVKETIVKGFFSRYPFKKESRSNKEILYEGHIKGCPQEYISLPELSDHKFVIVYVDKP